jgi:hypothetical protein
MQVFGRVMTLGAVAVTVIAGTTTAASAATIDSTCQSQYGGVSTCEWLVTSVVYDKYIGKYDTQIVTWAQMKGGAANREILEIQLQERGCTFTVCAILVVQEGVQNLAGTSTISAHIGPILCNYPNYRPLFTWKEYEGKLAGWVTGTSYGAWEPNPGSPCSSI